MSRIACLNCSLPYPEMGVPYRCPRCGGLFDYLEWPVYQPAAVDPTQVGIWQYRAMFGLPETAPQVTLGEGNTPLVWADVGARRVAFKLDFLNPTAAYKDRGSATLVSFLLSRGVTEALEDSSGNAGASFAAYAARAGIRARVFVPEAASGPKRAQIEAYGAELVRIMGPRSNAAEAVIRVAEQGFVYASHGYLPFGLPGYASLAYELVAQLGCAPGCVLIPAGMGNLLLAMGRGFRAMQAAGVIERLPQLVAIQAAACAPLWAVFHYGAAGLGWVTEGETLAEGVRVKHPLRGDALLQILTDSGGTVLAVDEDKILPGRDQLARLGLLVEPTSAIVWDALEQIAEFAPDPIVLVLTGSGLKSTLG